MAKLCAIVVSTIVLAGGVLLLALTDDVDFGFGTVVFFVVCALIISAASILNN